MPKISVIIPTCNRPQMLKKAIESVLAQTYQDFEIVVVDDGQEMRADDIVKSFNDSRIIYIAHETRKGGGAARNTGIRNSKGQFIAFLDDDDEWLPEKLAVQMKEFVNMPEDVGFCFSAVKNIYEDKERISVVPEGIAGYHELALRRVKGFLTVTLIIKRQVFDEVGYFDEKFPSHQEADLMIRVTEKFKGLGINKPLVLVDMTEHEQTGRNLERRIEGRKMILEKYFDKFKKHPKVLARHYFWLALMYRDNGQSSQAKQYFKKAWQTRFNLRYFFHYLKFII